MSNHRRDQEDHGRQDGPVHRRLQEQPHQDPHRPRQPGAARHGARRLLRLAGAASARWPTCRCSTARTISVQPWEKGMGAKIEKAIRESDLGLNPASMGDLIRVPMPPMSEERRKEMTKLVRNEGESAKIAMRNLRRDANDAVKKLVKDKLASEDDQKRAEAEIQKVTDRHIAEIDQLVAAKEAGDHGGLRPRCRSAMTARPRRDRSPPHRHRHGRQRPLGDAALPAARGGPQEGRRRAARLRAPLRRARREGADRVRVLLRELEPPARGSLRPDGTAGGGARRARCRSCRPRACASTSSATASALSDKVRAGLVQAEAATAGNTRLVFNICFNYGGRWDIAQAAARLAARGEPITEASLDRAMALAHVPDPDLLIRTGGEQRISNFLLWQARLRRAVLQRQAVARVRRGRARRGHRRLRQRASAASARPPQQVAPPAAPQKAA